MARKRAPSAAARGWRSGSSAARRSPTRRPCATRWRSSAPTTARSWWWSPRSPGVTDLAPGRSAALRRRRARGGLPGRGHLPAPPPRPGPRPRPRGRRDDACSSPPTPAREYREIAHAMAALGDLSPGPATPWWRAGERASSALVAAALRAAGRKAERVDAAEIVATDGRHGGAAPDLAAPRKDARAAPLPSLKRGLVPVVPGFIGRAPTAASPPWAAAGPTSPRRCSAASLGARASCCGRTCPASSPPTRARCPTRASCPSSTIARRPRWPTSGPRSCTRAPSSPWTAAASPCTCARSWSPSGRAPRSRPGARCRATR